MGHFGRLGARGRVILAAVGLTLLTGCDSIDMPNMPDFSSWSCDRPGETSMTVARLYMGGQLPGGAYIGEFEWQQFLATAVVPRFPDGVRSSDVAFEYNSKAGAGAVQDNTKLLVIIAPSGDDTENKLDAVVTAFSKRFNSQAVTLIQTNDCVEKW